MPTRINQTAISISRELRDWLKHYKDSWGVTWDELLYNIVKQFPKDEEE